MTFSLTVKTAQEVSDAAMAGAKATAKRNVIKMAQAVYDAVTEEYPEGERLTWDKQEQAARAHNASNASSDQNAALDARASITGETRSELAAKIITTADSFATLGLALSGVRSKAYTEIDAATTEAEVNAAVVAAQTSITALTSA